MDSEALKRVPKVWAHNHRDDISDSYYEADMISACETCKERFEDAVLNGRACEKHPGALCNPKTKATSFWCEVCEEEEQQLKRRAERYILRLQIEEIQGGQPSIPSQMIPLLKQAYIEGAHENGGERL